MNFFSYLIPLALAAVIIVLFLGVFSMVKGGEFNDKYGNKLMRWRVILQAVAVVLIVLSLTLGNS
jgi:nitrogen fixation-related uncharacterized protein